MKFQDLFVPRWQNSNPAIRIKALGRIKDVKLLEQIAQNDEAENVRYAASARLTTLREEL
jgi:hypothetical protein